VACRVPPGRAAQQSLRGASATRGSGCWQLLPLSGTGSRPCPPGRRRPGLASPRRPGLRARPGGGGRAAAQLAPPSHSPQPEARPGREQQRRALARAQWPASGWPPGHRDRHVAGAIFRSPCGCHHPSRSRPRLWPASQDRASLIATLRIALTCSSLSLSLAVACRAS
jgi:hypothetical protein